MMDWRSHRAPEPERPAPDNSTERAAEGGPQPLGHVLARVLARMAEDLRAAQDRGNNRGRTA